MQVHILKPYRNDKNHGLGINQAMAMIGNDDWGCICDLDTCFLTPDAGSILLEYAKRNPTAGILTCFTNRISPLSKMQLLNGVLDDNPNMADHVLKAEKQKEQLYNTTEIDRDISGFLMMVSKRIWEKYPFPELGKPLGVDTKFGRTIREAGLKILRMDGLLVFHIYRLVNGIADKKHLQV